MNPTPLDFPTLSRHDILPYDSSVFVLTGDIGETGDLVRVGETGNVEVNKYHKCPDEPGTGPLKKGADRTVTVRREGERPASDKRTVGPVPERVRYSEGPRTRENDLGIGY